MTDALLQVFLIVSVGILVAWLGWIDEASTNLFSGLVLRVFMPALLFRSMASVSFESLSVTPILSYLTAGLLMYALAFVVARYWGPRADRQESVVGLSAATAICAIFSNNVMVGIPIVKLFYGPDGLVVLLTVLSMHALVLLGFGTLVFELTSKGRSPQSRWLTARQLVQTAVLHPVVVPILLGVVVSYFAIPMPILIDSTLAALGQVGVPCCLVLLGASVFHARNRFQARGVGLIILFKLALMPAVVFLLAQFVFELEPLAVAVLTTMGALPTGANPYLLTQRYNQGVSMAATAVAATTALSVISLPYVLSQFAHVR